MPITPAFCFAHARRGFFELADIEKNAREGSKGKPVSPIALEAVRRLDALFEIERAINGRSADERRAVRQERSKPLLDDMHAWLLRERETLSRSSEVLKPTNYMLRRWADFARFLDDSRICLSNNAAERALRGIALGRRNCTFAGSLRGAERAAIMLTMITTCRLNDVDPKAWLADLLARIADLPASRLHELLPCWGGRLPTGIAMCLSEFVEVLNRGKPSVEKIIRIGMDTSNWHGYVKERFPVAWRERS
ncbi:hypothetical protein ACVILL_001061 [Bradyrhizobium sp. USDA 3364]